MKPTLEKENLSNISLEKLKEWNAFFKQRKPRDLLEWILENYQDRVALACSLSAEDTVLLHILASISKNARVFVLDTGRLYEETYETLESCRSRYGLKIELYFPKNFAVEKLIKNKGSYSFYKSLANRKECCSIRKLEPLKRALHGLDAWITGLRHEQSITRTEMQMLELDQMQVDSGETRTLLKVNPLLNWNWKEVLEFAEKNKVPLHPLHAKGYPSIGCAPCTRAVQKGEELRSGRWWWEETQNKECGLHIKKSRPENSH